MPVFHYRAIGPTGEIQQGDLDAPTLTDVAAQLQRGGLIVLRIDPAGAGFWRLSFELGGGQALRRGELVDVTRELSAMLGAGQDLDRALRSMVETAVNKRVGAVLTRLRDQVRDGAALSAALAKEPKSFPKLYVGLVRAGEAGGDLAGTLERLAGLLERQRSLTAAIQSAMIYPCILVVAATGSIFLLLTRVLPQFVPLFAENGVALPPSTAFLLGLGNVISNYGVLGLVLTVAGVVGARMLLDRPGPRLAADALLLRLPVVGGLLRDVLAARFSRTLGTLLLNGVPLMAAMTTVKDIISNRVASEAVGRAVESAKNGQGISRALAAAAVFPVRMTQLLRLGEETAQLGPMALRAADMHEERTRIGLNRLVALLVPAITILMGAAVAGIVSSLLLAMLSLNDIAQ
jgi:general secretion pathway protein F